jgi:hypothetical protein
VTAAGLFARPSGLGRGGLRFLRRGKRLRRRPLTADERTRAFSRALATLGPLCDAAEDDPLVVADIAVALLGHASKHAGDPWCSEAEWVDRELWLAALAVETVASWKAIPWQEALQLLGDQLEAKHFEQEVADDIRGLPE